MSGYLIAYDAGCGPCEAFRRAVSLLDSAKRLRFVPLGEADASGMLDAVPPDSRYRSFHMVDGAGGVQSGGAAIPSLMKTLFPGRVVPASLVRSPGGRRVLASAYSALSRLHRPGSCSLERAE